MIQLPITTWIKIGFIIAFIIVLPFFVREYIKLRKHIREEQKKEWEEYERRKQS